MKTKLPSTKMDKTRQIITKCPHCNSKDLIKDYHHEETYCNHCGLVLSEPFNYNGLAKTVNSIPYSPSFEARKGIQVRWFDEKLGRFVSSSKIIRYYHNIPDNRIMKKGI